MIKWLLAEPPHIGSRWHRRGADPWKYEVIVDEVKDGWVKYSYPWGKFQPLTIRNFRVVYRHRDKAQP